MYRSAVCIFLRPIVPGQVKTRLAAVAGAETAAQLYTAFARDCIKNVASAGHHGSLWIAGDPEHPSLAGLLVNTGAADWPRFAQVPGDLGARQRGALRWALEHADGALAIGTDAPTLPATLVARACDDLTRHDMVIGPAADGGYYLLGVRNRVAPDLLRGVRWSSPHTLADTLASARACGYRPRLLPPFYDVDQPRDLVLLRTHLALDPKAAPHSASALACLPDSAGAVACLPDSASALAHRSASPVR